MKSYNIPYMICFCFLLSCICVLPTTLAENKINVKLTGDSAKVNRITGEVLVYKPNMDKPIAVKLGDLLYPGDRVQTGKRSRIELYLPDKSYIRFDEYTHFELITIDVPKDNSSRSIFINMLLGKTWAKVNPFTGKNSHFQIMTQTASAGVRGTVYRLNVDTDQSVTIKVYRGEIIVKKLLPSRPEADETPIQPFSKPYSVEGPAKIPGPHPVTPDEWVHIVKSLHQIDITPDGTATKPFSFDPDEDKDDWVKWNLELDDLQKE